MSARNAKKEKARNMEQLNRRYVNRITVAKHGKVLYEKSDYINAIKHYNMYLKIIADVKEVDEKRINPGLFNPEQELSEMLLISHIYWDLTRIYDRTPHLNKEFHRCLGQFLAFTTGHPYQVVNSEMLRRYIRSGKLINKKDFQEAYQKIYVNSKKCYIATHAFGFEDQVTNEIRKFRPQLMSFKLGRVFTSKYYLYSPDIVRFLEKHKLVDFIITKCIVRPFLFSFAKVFSYFKN